MAIRHREDISHVVQVKNVAHTECSSINIKGRNNRRPGRRWEHNIKIEQTCNKCTQGAQKPEQSQSIVTIAIQLSVFFLLGDFPSTGFYVPTFRNTLSAPSS